MLLPASLLLMATAQSTATIAVYDPDAHSRTVTECDRQMAHPDDPHRIAPGIARKDADLPAAVQACEAATAADPDNPRLQYQLARAYGYSDLGKKALPWRAKSVAAGYPQSLFVVGFITMLGLNEQPQDLCEGGRLIRASAKAGRLAGQIAFPDYVLEGRFASCGFDVTRQELLSYLEAAQQYPGGDFYREILIRRLADDVQSEENLAD